MKKGFDNDQYIRLQSEHIRSRIDQFGGKLYLEFGGKLFDDNHASRVLQYYSQLITNTLNTFAFSDNSTSLLLPEQCIFWFYAQTTDPTLLYYQTKLVDKFTDPATDYNNNGKPYSKQLVTGSYARHLPLMMVWGAGTSGTVTANLDLGTQPSSLYYIAEGKNPICVMRSGWDTTDWWVGFKAGNPSCPHGHMDVGCFLFEYGGARFAVDLGSDSYNKVSSHISTSLFARWRQNGYYQV